MKTVNKQKAAYGRVVPRDGKPSAVTVVGRRRAVFGDLYMRTLSWSWIGICLTALGLYLGVNVLFAAAYLAIGNGIENARPGSFVDAFFFSVQTMATIGYGKLIPNGIAANILVTFEAFIGFGYFAGVTGLLFAKFSRPTARVLFSRVAVVSPGEGGTHFMCRLSNERANRIVNATVSMVVLLSEETPGSGFRRRFHDMRLLRSQIPLMQLSWTMAHPIDKDSPIYGMTLEDLEKREAEIIVTLTGLDETTSQTIHARQSFIPEEIHFNSVFEDVLLRTNGKLILNYERFHDVRKLEG